MQHRGALSSTASPHNLRVEWLADPRSLISSAFRCLKASNSRLLYYFAESAKRVSQIFSIPFTVVVEIRATSNFSPFNSHKLSDKDFKPLSAE